MIAMDRCQLLRDIQSGTAKLTLRPTRTVDKSRPVLLVDGEQLKVFTCQPVTTSFSTVPVPPPPPPPAINGFKWSKTDPGSKVYKGMAKRNSAPINRDALLSDIRRGIPLKKVPLDVSVPTDPIQQTPRFSIPAEEFESMPYLDDRAPKFDPLQENTVREQPCSDGGLKFGCSQSFSSFTNGHHTFTDSEDSQASSSDHFNHVQLLSSTTAPPPAPRLPPLMPMLLISDNEVPLPKRNPLPSPSGLSLSNLMHGSTLRKSKSDNCLADSKAGSFDEELKKAVLSKHKEREEMFSKACKRHSRAWDSGGVEQECKTDKVVPLHQPQIVITNDWSPRRTLDIPADRDTLMQEIRNGVTLRRVTSKERLPEDEPDELLCGTTKRGQKQAAVSPRPSINIGQHDSLMAELSRSFALPKSKSDTALNGMDRLEKTPDRSALKDPEDDRKYAEVPTGLPSSEPPVQKVRFNLEPLEQPQQNVWNATAEMELESFDQICTDDEIMAPPSYPPPPPPDIQEGITIIELNSVKHEAPPTLLMGKDRIGSTYSTYTNSDSIDGTLSDIQTDRRSAMVNAPLPWRPVTETTSIKKEPSSPLRNWQLTNEHNGNQIESLARSVDPRPSRSFDSGRPTRTSPNFGAIRDRFESNSRPQRAQFDPRRASVATTYGMKDVVESNFTTSSASSTPAVRVPFPQNRKFFTPVAESESKQLSDEKKSAASHLSSVLRRKIDEDLETSLRSDTYEPERLPVGKSGLAFNNGADNSKVAHLMSIPVDDLKNFHFAIDLTEENGDILRIKTRYDDN